MAFKNASFLLALTLFIISLLRNSVSIKTVLDQGIVEKKKTKAFEKEELCHGEVLPLEKVKKSTELQNKPQNWLRRQLSREMSSNHSVEEVEYATAVAAAAFAVKELDPDAGDRRKTESERRTSLPRMISGLISSAFSGEHSEPPKYYADDYDDGITRMVPEKTIHPVPSVRRKPTTPKKRLTFADELAEDPSKPSVYGNSLFGEEEWKEVERMKPTSTPSFRRGQSVKKTSSFGEKEVEDSRRSKPISMPSFRRTPTVKKTSSFGEERIRQVPQPILPPPIPPPPAVPPLLQPAAPPKRGQRSRGQENDADAWEGEEMAKIKRRYEKLNATILNWENKKKKKARRKLEMTEVRAKFNHQSACEKIKKAILTDICLQASQRDPDKRRVKAMHNYHIEMERIKQIADGARAQAEDKQRNEEMKVREKANKYRETGEPPQSPICLCL